MERPIIQFYNVFKKFNANQVLRGVSLRIFQGHVVGQTLLKNFAAQIKQYLDITDSCSRYSLDRILVVLHNANIEDARRFATRLERELRFEDLLATDNRDGFGIRISAGYAQAEEDSLIKEVLAKAESKDSRYYEFELH